MTDHSIPDLHDWTVVEAQYLWDPGILQIVVQGPSHRGTVVVHGVVSFSAERKEPWGPSTSINAVEITERTDGVPLTVVFELQSGDQVVVSGEAVDFTTPDA